jgi:predicted MFS family arabinose efflux permease
MRTPISAATTRGATDPRGLFWQCFSALEMLVRDVGASMHSCSFHLGQSAGSIAHGVARLHPDKWPGVLMGAAIIAGLAYVLAAARRRTRRIRARTPAITRRANKSDVIA